MQEILLSGLQATILYAVFALFNFLKSPLFIIISFPSLPIRKRKLVFLLVISCKTVNAQVMATE